MASKLMKSIQNFFLALVQDKASSVPQLHNELKRNH